MKKYFKSNKKIIGFGLLSTLVCFLGLLIILFVNNMYQAWIVSKQFAIESLKYQDANNWSFNVNYFFNNSGKFLNNQVLFNRNVNSFNSNLDLVLIMLQQLNFNANLSLNQITSQIDLNYVNEFAKHVSNLNIQIQLFSFFSWLTIIFSVFLTIFFIWNLTLTINSKNTYQLLSYFFIFCFNVFGIFVSFYLWKKKSKKINQELSNKWFETLKKYPPFLWINHFVKFFSKFDNKAIDLKTFIQTKNLSFTYNHKHKFLKHLIDVIKLSFQNKAYKEKYHVTRRNKLFKFITWLFPFLVVKEKMILNNLNINIAQNSFTSIIGPNGSGKSTLIKTLIGLENHYFGSIYWNNKNLFRINRKSFAQNVSYFPQILDIPDKINVYDFVAFGRIPHQDLSGHLSIIDKKIIYENLKKTNTLQFINKKMEELSGGQRQNVIIAAILVQQTYTIILDEPTTYLDQNNQYLLLKLLKDLNKNKKTVITILHDVNQAITYSDNIIVLKDGSIYASGAPKDIITKKLIKDVFEVDCEIQYTNAGLPILTDINVIKKEQKNYAK